MTDSTAPFLTELAKAAESLAIVLEQAREACMEAGRQDLVDWIDLELDGYQGKGTIFAYRKLAGVNKAVISNGQVTLADYVVRDWDTTVVAGVRDLIKLPELREAIEQKREFLRYDIDPDDYVFRRFLSACKPGYKAERSWAEIPLAGLSNMVQAIGERLEQVMANIHRRPDWW